MALFHLMRALGRHPWLVAAGLALTSGALLLTDVTHTGVHQIRAGVVLAAPQGSGVVNPLFRREYSVISSAGLITSMVNADDAGARVSSSSATLAGRGVTDGYSVSLFNRGGQWVYDYDRPVIDVQAVGLSADEAALNFDRALSGLNAALTELQDRSDVPAERRMFLQVVPESPALGYGEGRPMIARAATLVLGAGLTLAAVMSADRRTGRPEPEGSPPGRHGGDCADGADLRAESADPALRGAGVGHPGP